MAAKPTINYEDNPRSIKFYVKRFIIANTDRLKGKKVVDFPAGNGITSRILREAGAIPIPLDLFPEYFEIPELKCVRANIREGLPLDAGSVDYIICQEGIEHFSDQFSSLQEFNRILKMDGNILITTPNYSNLRSKMSYLLSESERFNSIMAPNELDSIWMTDKSITSELYFGHIFLIGIQKLRVLASLTGFKIDKIHYTRKKSTSLLLLPFLYPFILLSSYITYRKNMRKNTDFDIETKKAVYGEIFNLQINPKLLVDGHLMIEFKKVNEAENVSDHLKSKHKEFGVT
jgi:SAM-dependent methyltransferase